MLKSFLKKIDPELWKLIEHEKKREKSGLELIPSENYVSKAVLEAMGSILTNKYSEGYPRKRYYGGNEWIDEIEELAKERALKIFKVSSKTHHANVQPHSGSPANIAVYVALAQFGDTLMGMNLSQGGHLTHGHKVNFSGKAYRFVQYNVRERDQRIDYDELWSLAKEHKPKIIISGATAYSRKIDFEKFQEIANDVQAIHMADISHIAGLIVAGLHPSPFPFTDVVTTTTHKTLRGPRGAIIISKNEFGEAINKAIFPGLQGGPHEHTIAAKAVCFKEAMTPGFKKYAAQIVKNAKALGEELAGRGFTLVSGGTDNHLLLVDLTNKGITGKQAQTTLDEVGITVNKNTVPYDTRSPFDPSGIRLGTPAVTTRGMKEKEMGVIAECIHETVKAFREIDLRRQEALMKKVKTRVVALASRFILPGVDL